MSVPVNLINRRNSHTLNLHLKYEVVKEHRIANLAAKRIYFLIGGAEEDRTPDPLLAKQVLSQLSYSPCLVLEFSSSLVLE